MARSSNRKDAMPLPLEGIRVLDLGISTAGPYAARFLADLGAEVLKIEPIEGENARSLGLRYGDAGYLFHVNNYNKSSVVLRVQSDQGRRLFLELVAQSDVVIENFASGTMDRWGIGYDDCRAVNPSIVYCSAKGFGENGALRDKRAFDTVVQGLCGLMDATGDADDPPLKGGPSVCDLMTAAANAMACASAIATRVPGESVFLFAPDGGVADSSAHPFRVVRFENATLGLLERGPIAVFGHGQFLGQGMLDPLPPKGKATVPFALDRSIAVHSRQRARSSGGRQRQQAGWRR